MGRYLFVALGLLLGSAVVGAGDSTATAQTTHSQSAPAGVAAGEDDLWRLLNELTKVDADKLAELKASRHEVEQRLLAMLSGDPTQRHSAICMMRDAPRNAPQLAEIVATPKLIDAVARELEKMLQVRAKTWDEAASRCVACQVLGRYPARKSITVLLHALDEPFVHHSLSPPVPPAGTAEHCYRTIWWDADAALRRITRASPVPEPAQEPEDTDRLQARAAWLKWWAENDIEVLHNEQIGKWHYRLYVDRASSRSRWTIGELSFDGKTITAESNGPLMWTPWGKLIFYEQGAWKRGWLPYFTESPAPEGKEMPSPDAETSKLVRERWEALRNAGESFRLNVVYRNGAAGGWFSLATQHPVTEFPPNCKAWQATMLKEQVPMVVDRIAAEGLLARALDPGLIRVGAKIPAIEIQFDDGRDLRLLLPLEPTVETVDQLRRITRDVGDAKAREQISEILEALSEFARRKTTETQLATQPSSSGYPYLAPEQRLQKAKEALDPATDEKARFQTVWGLAISGYTRESAEALAVIAVDGARGDAIREYAAMGLINFTHSMPLEVRRAVQDKLYGALNAEKETLPGGVIRVLVVWGDADRVWKVLGDKLRDHPMEVIVLEGISRRETAVARLWEIYQAATPAKSGNIALSRAWHAGAALIRWRDKRGIDILLECLEVKDAEDANSASFRQSQHNTFVRIASVLDNSFGYESSGTWTPQLNEAIPRMVEWWKANRQTWTFEGEPRALCRSLRRAGL